MKRSAVAAKRFAATADRRVVGLVVERAVVLGVVVLTPTIRWGDGSVRSAGPAASAESQDELQAARLVAVVAVVARAAAAGVRAQLRA